MTGNDLIARALRLINVLASGEVPQANEAQDALATLNNMLDSWSTQRMQIFTVQRVANDVNGQPFTLVSGQQAYTVGTGGNFNIPRPPYIQRVGIINQPLSAQPLELPLEYLTAEDWAAIPVKSIQSALPLRVWDDRGFPFRTLSYWCVPNVPVQTVLYVWQALNSFPDLVTDVTFPPGYAKALAFNLAVDLWPEYAGATGAPVPPSIMQQAELSLAAIQLLNPQEVTLRCDPAVITPSAEVYNWITDNAGRQYRG